MATLTEIINARREAVITAYNAAKAENRQRFLEGDVKATEEYIFPNQRADAQAIADKFYKDGRYVISVQKKTKVGADGLMIEIATLLTTHPDDNFVFDPTNLRIITGMSNAGWEKDMIDKAPTCFKGKIFHHGKLSKADLVGLKNSLTIIDEIDTGDKEYQILHNTLKEAGVLDIEHMKKNNNRFVFISATMIKELYDLYRWGSLHELYKMTIPDTYIGHKDFLERGIIKDFFSLDNDESAEKWVHEDILEHYGTDYRVHLVRVNPKTVNVVQNACIRKGVIFKNHTSTDRLSPEEITELFKEPLTGHIVLGVKGFFRRANLSPNAWKMLIGATHELYTKKVDNNVQIQGLAGRMTGYWRHIIDSGHKTGPYRTSIKAIKEYENVYEDPFGPNTYKTSGFQKKAGRVHASNTMLSTRNIKHLVSVPLPDTASTVVDSNKYRVYDDEDIVRNVCNFLGYTYTPTKANADGFKETSLNSKKGVALLSDAIKKVHTAYGTNNGTITHRTYYPCYVDVTDASTLRYVVILRSKTDPAKITECDETYPSIIIM